VAIDLTEGERSRLSEALSRQYGRLIQLNVIVDPSVGGSYRTTTANVMRSFDRLPPEAREALANAPSNWVPQPFLTSWRRGEFKTGQELAHWIAVLSRRTIAKWEDQRSRGVRPYKGCKPASQFELTTRRRR
jgi:hypothetical protein